MRNSIGSTQPCTFVFSLLIGHKLLESVTWYLLLETKDTSSCLFMSRAGDYLLNQNRLTASCGTYLT
jgi:hypothetical protein